MGASKTSLWNCGRKKLPSVSFPSQALPSRCICLSSRFGKRGQLNMPAAALFGLYPCHTVSSTFQAPFRRLVSPLFFGCLLSEDDWVRFLFLIAPPYAVETDPFPAVRRTLPRQAHVPHLVKCPYYLRSLLHAPCAHHGELSSGLLKEVLSWCVDHRFTWFLQSNVVLSTLSLVFSVSFKLSRSLLDFTHVVVALSLGLFDTATCFPSTPPPCGKSGATTFPAGAWDGKLVRLWSFYLSPESSGSVAIH